VRTITHWLAGLRDRILDGMTPLVIATLGVGVALLAVPTVRVPSPAIDYSWSFGILTAITEGRQFGVDVVFTYGPWAQLDIITSLSSRALLVGVIVWVASAFLFIFTAWRLARAWLGAIPAALLVTVVVAPAVAVQGGVSDRVLLLAVMAALGLVIGTISPGSRMTTVIGLSVAGALMVQVKFSGGVLAVATILLAAALSPGQRWLQRIRSVVVALVAAVASTAVFWILAGQSLGNLPAWVRGSLEITSGYSDAMGIESTALVGQSVVYAVGVLVLLVLAILYRGPAHSRWALVVLFAWIAFVGLRLGFTRHDLGHPAQSFLLMVVAVLAVTVVRARWMQLAAIGVAASMVFASWSLTYSQVVDPSRWASGTSGVISALVSAEQRESLLQTGYATVTKEFPLDPQVRAALRDRTVHVDPSDAMVALAYNLAWKPVPVLQSYSAYTAYLDELDASALDNSDGPESVLRSPLRSIDYRNPIWESPAYSVSLVCNFETKIETADWQVLDRVPDRCGDPIELATAKVEPGVPVTVPNAPGENCIVYARFDIPRSLAERAVEMLFKPSEPFVLGVDKDRYRIPRAHLSGPLIVSIPASVGWGQQFGGDTDYRTITSPKEGRVTFYAVRVS
jgi:hypothetical protein